MSVKNENYCRISAIIDSVPGVVLHTAKHGGSFKFPIYMNESLEIRDIGVMELSPRAYNSLKRAGVDTIGSLCNKILSSRGLSDIRSCGALTRAEIMDALFFYQYSILSSERKKRFIDKVIQMNS